MKIFRRSLQQEFTTLTAATAAVLLSIALSTQVIRLLGMAAAGSIQLEGVVAFLAFSALGYLPIILGLTLFFAVLMTLTRWYADSEMIVWFSSGVGLTRCIVPVLRYSMPLALLVSALSLAVSPWALRQSTEYQRQLDTRDDLSLLAPGVFKESKYGDRVFFVENLSPDEGEIHNVFVQSVQQERLGVVVANSGNQRVEANGDKFLVLNNGRRYDGTPGSLEYKVIDFKHYALRIDPYEARGGQVSTKALPTQALLSKPTRETLAELHWRLALPIGVVVLGLAAIPLSFVNPRGSRSINLVIAILAYVTYSNLLSIGQAWIAQGRLSPLVGLWPIHAGMLAIVALMFYRRTAIRPWRRLWRRQAG